MNVSSYKYTPKNGDNHRGINSLNLWLRYTVKPFRLIVNVPFLYWPYFNKHWFSKEKSLSNVIVTNKNFSFVIKLLNIIKKM